MVLVGGVGDVESNAEDGRRVIADGSMRVMAIPSIGKPSGLNPARTMGPFPPLGSRSGLEENPYLLLAFS